MRRFGSRLIAMLRPRVGAKIFLAVGALVPSIVAVAAVGAVGLQRTHEQSVQLYAHNVVSGQRSTELAAALAKVSTASLEEIAAYQTTQRRELDSDLDQSLIPRLQQAIQAARDIHRTEPESLRRINEMAAGVSEYLDMRRAGAYKSVGLDAQTQRSNAAAVAGRTAALFNRLTGLAQQLETAEVQDAQQIKLASDRAYYLAGMGLAVSVGVSMLVGLAIVLVLIRNLLPRIRRYSQFAEEVAGGRPTTTLRLRGRDEVTELGLALNEMIHQRDRLDRYEESQAEFIDTMQVTESEQEAQELLQRHLERSLPGSAVVVLKRNNSANRLEAATAPDEGSALATRLVGADPRSCLALRFSRTHLEGLARPPLLSCQLCGDRAGLSTCEPLLVGGEVIGSVLATHELPLDDADQSRIKNSVAQAAPMLANLRNLALAEFRANSDSLTGLPNKRASEDTLRRMVAQANRTITPLAALMLDLDHFKQVNDRFGHPQGDEVLAAVGAAISSSLRASDFSGRYGGEEFLILLPETTVDSALLVAEKIRSAIANVSVGDVEHLSASIGIAGLLEHAGNAAGLLREADRALYAAKVAGRNRVVVASIGEAEEAKDS